MSILFVSFWDSFIPTSDPQKLGDFDGRSYYPFFDSVYGPENLLAEIRKLPNWKQFDTEEQEIIQNLDRESLLFLYLFFFPFFGQTEIRKFTIPPYMWDKPNLTYLVYQDFRGAEYDRYQYLIKELITNQNWVSNGLMVAVSRSITHSCSLFVRLNQQLVCFNQVVKSKIVLIWLQIFDAQRTYARSNARDR